jgi:SAM-dependent methyltransferase
MASRLSRKRRDIRSRTADFDIVTAIMSLHHIPDLGPVMAEIIRVLKPGGYLFLKEHDVWSPADCALIDIEHALHMTLSGEIAPGSLPPPDYYIQYRNYVAFDEIFSALKYIKSNYFHPIDRYTILPTRAYWVIYQKPPLAAPLHV